MTDKPWPPYSYLEQAAAEAREASRRYWAKGGAADRKYPVHSDVEKHWPLAPDPEEQDRQRKPLTERGKPGC
jgi:hypothetical protein